MSFPIPKFKVGDEVWVALVAWFPTYYVLRSLL